MLDHPADACGLVSVEIQDAGGFRFREVRSAHPTQTSTSLHYAARETFSGTLTISSSPRIIDAVF